jgi:lactose/L-arabinose transport system permease protein
MMLQLVPRFYKHGEISSITLKLTHKERLFFSLILIGFITLFIAFRIVPIGYTVWRSFFTIQQGQYIFAGFNAYNYVLNQPTFWQSIVNSFIISMMYILLKIGTLILVGEWLMRHPYLQHWFIKIAYIPTIVGGFVYAILFRYLLDSNGFFSSFVQNLQLFNSIWFNQLLMAIILLWTSFGVSLLMYLNRRRHLNKTLIEFSRVEGANAVQQFRYVIFPHLKSVISLIILLSTIDVFNEIELPMNLTFGGPQQSTITFGYLNYISGLIFGNFGYASASTVVFLLILFLLVTMIKGIYESVQKAR